MQRLDILDNKIPSVEKFEEYDKKLHSVITKIGSSIGNALKRMEKLEREFMSYKEEKDPSKERVEMLEEVIENLSVTFASLKREPSKKKEALKFIYVPKVSQPNFNIPTSSGKEEPKIISEHHVINRLRKQTPIYDTRVLDFLPRSIMIKIALEASTNKTTCLVENYESDDEKT